jgi:hypothetical protein
MGERDEDGLLGVADTQLALQAAYDVLRLLALTSGEHLRDNRDLLCLRLYEASGQCCIAGLIQVARTEWPALRAISFKFLNTNGSVSGFGLKRVF